MAKHRGAVVYHSLGRQQLQKLCKKHGLAANKSNAQMADALASLFQSEELNTGHLDDGDAAVQTSSPNSDADTVDERNERADNGCRNGENIENINLVEGALDRTAANVGVSYSSENQTEGSLMVDTAFASSRAQRDDFQFFVECEEGITLYVDLNSNPVHWMKSQNCELFIPRQIHDHRVHERIPRLTPTKCHGISEETISGRKLGLQSEALTSGNACKYNSNLTAGCANFYSTQNFGAGGSERPDLYNRTGEVASENPCILMENLEGFRDPGHASSALKTLLHGETVCSSSVVPHNASSFSSSVVSHGGANGFSPSSSADGCHKPQVAQNKETQIQRSFQVHCSQEKTQNAKHCRNVPLEAFQDQEQRDISRHKDEYKKIPVAKNLRTMKILARGSIMQGDILARRRSSRLVNKVYPRSPP